MLSEKQFQEKIEKVRKVIATFLKGNYTISDVSDETGIPFSSVQRYLHDEEFIQLCFASNAADIIANINDKLETNKAEGLSRGGIHSSFNNVSFRDAEGHYRGSRKI